MNVYWTNHALKRLQERFHNHEELRVQVTAAARTLPKWKGRFLHWVVGPARCVFERAQDRRGGVRVITVYDNETDPDG